MNGRAVVEVINTLGGSGLTVKVPADQKKFIREIVHNSLKKKDSPVILDFILSAKVQVIDAFGSNLSISFESNPLIRIATEVKKRSSSQNSTLRGIERFIFIATNGYEPTKDDLYWIHEGLLEKYSIWVTNPLTGVSLPKRTSDPSMTTTEMSKIVEGSLNDLASLDIPETILKAIGNDMKKLWEGWYSWRYNQETDPLLEAESSLSMEDYKKIHPVCELCALAGVNSDPIEIMHIISKGADESLYEMPWNWIASNRSHHNLQHNEGWEIIERSYPHIKGKIQRARLMQGGNKNS